MSILGVVIGLARERIKEVRRALSLASAWPRKRPCREAVILTASTLSR